MGEENCDKRIEGEIKNWGWSEFYWEVYCIQFTSWILVRSAWKLSLFM
jgi:hypothetical protein